MEKLVLLAIFRQLLYFCRKRHCAMCSLYGERLYFPIYDGFKRRWLVLVEFASISLVINLPAYKISSALTQGRKTTGPVLWKDWKRKINEKIKGPFYGSSPPASHERMKDERQGEKLSFLLRFSFVTVS